MKDLSFTQLVQQAVKTKDRTLLQLIINEIERRQTVTNFSKTEIHDYIKGMQKRKQKRK